MKGLIIIDEMHVPNSNVKVSACFSEMLKKRKGVVLCVTSTPQRCDQAVEMPVSEVTSEALSHYKQWRDEPMQDTQRSFTSLFNVTTRSRIHNDTILKTLTETLGTHVIEVLKRTDRAAEYLANWKVQCRIESDRCVVLRDGVIIAEGFYA